MNDLIIDEIKIEDMIYKIRNKQVMLDSDLAKLYKCKNGTKEINQAVKNNPQKFPERFSFKITEDEFRNLKSKFLTSSYGGSRKGHSVFTEQGVYMLATILKTKIATQVTIEIMDAFVNLRNYIDSIDRISNIETKVIKHDNDIKLLQKLFNKFEEKKQENELYFNGKIYDAYSKVLDIFKEAKKELIIIDRYVDKTLLDMIKDLKSKIILITCINSGLTDLDIKKYNETYNNLKVIYNNTYHDRYFIIDSKKIYHSGNSINHIGYRKSNINILGDDKVKQEILKDVNKIIV